MAYNIFLIIWASNLRVTKSKHDNYKWDYGRLTPQEMWPNFIIAPLIKNILILALYFFFFIHGWPPSFG